MTSKISHPLGSVPLPTEPAIWKLWLLRWVGLYPTLLLLYLVLGPFILHWPVPVRLFLMSGLGSMSLSFLVMPRLTLWFAGWLQRPELGLPVRASTLTKEFS